MLQQELLHALKRGVFVCDKTIRPPTSQFQNAKRTLEEKQTTRMCNSSFPVWWVVSLRDTPSRMRWRTWEHQSLIQTQFATQHREATQLNALEKQSWWSYTTLLPHVARPPLLALTKRGSTTLRQNKCPLLTTRLPAGWISTLSTPKAMFHALFWMMELFSMRMLPFFSTLLTWYTVQHTLHSSFS